MNDAITRRVATLEARRQHRDARRFLPMPWDLEPDAGPDDMVIRIHFVRPTDRFGGERVPYVRTGINPAEYDPEPHNGRLHHETAGARAWSSQTYLTGTTITLPHNDREPLEGGTPCVTSNAELSRWKSASRPRHVLIIGEHELEPADAGFVIRLVAAQFPEKESI